MRIRILCVLPLVAACSSAPPPKSNTPMAAQCPEPPAETRSECPPSTCPECAQCPQCSTPQVEPKAPAMALYRSSSAGSESYHVATFDVSEGCAMPGSPEPACAKYNAENCEIARRLFQNQPGVTHRYRCQIESPPRQQTWTGFVRQGVSNRRAVDVVGQYPDFASCLSASKAKVVGPRGEAECGLGCRIVPGDLWICQEFRR